MVESIVKDKVYYKIFDRSCLGSTLIYSKFKFNDEGKIAEVEKNCQLVALEMNAKNVFILKQVHGKKVIEVAKDTNLEAEEEADASVTTESGIALAIQTADCVPVLFSCSEGKVIGAAHCGWRSAKLNIISKVADRMRAKGAKNIKAIIGPSIQQFSYEVDELYYKDFISDTKENSVYFIPSVNKGHYMFNLPAYVRQKLLDENIEPARHIDEDTYSMGHKYPSYRRSCHAGRKYSQNILSVIVKK